MAKSWHAQGTAFAETFQAFRKSVVRVSRAKYGSSQTYFLNIDLLKLQPHFTSISILTKIKKGEGDEENISLAVHRWLARLDSANPFDDPKQNQRWQEIKGEDPLPNRVANLRQACAKFLDVLGTDDALDSNFVGVADDQSSQQEKSSTASSAPAPPIGHNNPPATWRLCSTEDFVAPDDTADFNRLFLHGARTVPWWTAAVSAVPRDSVIEELRKKLQYGTPSLVIHGAKAQGKTTILRQLCCDWLKSGRVIEIIDKAAFADPAFVDQLSVIGPPLLIVADEVPISPNAVTFATYAAFHAGRAKLVLTSQSSERKTATAAFGNTQPFLLRDPDPTESAAIIARIGANAAVDEMSKPEVARLFDEGLNARRGAGFWSAMYGATRGQGLDARMGELVQRVSGDPAKLLALAGVVFVNELHDDANDTPGLTFRVAIRRSLMAGLIDELDVDVQLSHAAKAALDGMHEWFEREILGDGLGGMSSNPDFTLRAPAASVVLANHIFGSKVAAAHFDRWRFYVPFVSALGLQAERRTGEQVAAASDAVATMYAAGRFLGRLDSGSGFDLGKFCRSGSPPQRATFDIMADHVDAMRFARPVDKARALVWKAALLHASEAPEAVIYLTRALNVVENRLTADLRSNIGTLCLKWDIKLPSPNGSSLSGVDYLAKFVR